MWTAWLNKPLIDRLHPWRLHICLWWCGKMSFLAWPTLFKWRFNKISVLHIQLEKLQCHVCIAMNCGKYNLWHPHPKRTMWKSAESLPPVLLKWMNCGIGQSSALTDFLGMYRRSPQSARGAKTWCHCIFCRLSVLSLWISPCDVQ